MEEMVPTSQVLSYPWSHQSTVAYRSLKEDKYLPCKFMSKSPLQSYKLSCDTTVCQKKDHRSFSLGRAVGEGIVSNSAMQPRRPPGAPAANGPLGRVQLLCYEIWPEPNV